MREASHFKRCGYDGWEYTDQREQLMCGVILPMWGNITQIKYYPDKVGKNSPTFHISAGGSGIQCTADVEVHRSSRCFIFASIGNLLLHPF